MLKNLLTRMASDSLYRNSLYLFISNALLAATGFAFWAIAARLFSADDVGIVSTIITAGTFIASASLLGLDHTLIHYLEKHKAKASAIINTAFSVVTCGVLVFSTIYLLIVPRATPELAFILSSPFWITMFTGLMLLTAWNNVVGSIFIAYRAAQFILLAGVLFGLGRIGFLVLSNGNGFTSLFNAHFISFGIGVGIALVCLALIKGHAFKPHFGKEVIKLIRGYSLRTYNASLLASLPPLLTPLFVIGVLGAKEAAYYNMPLLMTGLLTIIPMATSQSLFAEGMHGKSVLGTHLKKSLKLIFSLLIPITLLVIGAGHFILTIFGPQYAAHGYPLLVLLGLATLLKAGSLPLTATLRALGDLKEIIIATFIYTVCLLMGAYIALWTTHQLWSIGIAVLVAEAILLLLYVYMIKNKWPRINGTAMVKDI